MNPGNDRPNGLQENLKEVRANLAKLPAGFGMPPGYSATVTPEFQKAVENTDWEDPAFHRPNRRTLIQTAAYFKLCCMSRPKSELDDLELEMVKSLYEELQGIPRPKPPGKSMVFAKQCGSVLLYIGATAGGLVWVCFLLVLLAACLVMGGGFLSAVFKTMGLKW